MEQSYRSNMRSLSVDFTHGGRPTGFDLGTTDVRSWLQQWPRVLSQLETLVVGLKRRYMVVSCGLGRNRSRLVVLPPPPQRVLRWACEIAVLVV